jgi:lactate dehydrogenase-like 2-hydroxyacid dehydrogenase
MMPSTLEALDTAFTLHRLWEQDNEVAFLREIGPRIRGVATSTLYRQIDAGFLKHLPHVEIVSSFGVGYDNVDTAAAAQRGIVVTNTPDVLNEEVADLTIGLLLATLRRVPQADRYLREGRWLNAPFPLSPTLRERRVGIVGLGRIGKASARRLEGFGVIIAYHGRTRQEGISYAYCSSVASLAEACDSSSSLRPVEPQRSISSMPKFCGHWVPPAS